MTLRSPSRGEYWKRMALVFSLGLAAYAIVVSERGGGSTLKIWRPDRMRFAAVILLVIGVAAYEFRPRNDETAEDDEADVAASTDVKAVPSEESNAHPEAREEIVRSDPEVRTADRPSERAPVAEPTTLFAREEDVTDAEVAWQKARDMPHNFVPDEVEDFEYLKLVRKAAELGHALAMVKLGDYAFRRGWVVEAYYWTLLAQLRGAPDLDVALGEIRKVWTMEGHPPEYENVRPDFSETQGVFARAVLRLKCGMDAPLARKRLQELRDLKCPEAALYLSRSQNRS